MSTRLKAYRSGASYHVMEQIDNMIAETQLDLYTETELERHRASKDQDGESWIVLKLTSFTKLYWKKTTCWKSFTEGMT
jgi:hypothetical protein